MALEWQQTGTTSPYPGLKCNSTTLATNPCQRQISISGSGGSEVVATLPSKTDYTVATFCTDAALGVTSIPAGTWNVKVNVTTAAASGCYISAVYICRLNSSGVSQATIASATGLTVNVATTGVKSIDVTQGSPHACSSTDRFSVQVVVFENAHAGSTLGITPNQLITDTITAVEEGTTVDVGNVGAVTVAAETPTTITLDATVGCTKGAVTVAGNNATINLPTVIEVGGGGTGKNLWPNADLESGIDDWNNNYESPISHSSAQKWEQTYSLFAEPTLTFASIKSDTKYIVEGSTDYIVSWYVYPVGSAISPVIYVYDQDDNAINAGGQGSQPSNEWSRLELIFTTGSDDTGIKLYMEPGAVVDYYIDGIQVELGSSATTWENYGAAGGPAAVAIASFSATVEQEYQINCTKGAVVVAGLAADVVVAAAVTTVDCTLGSVTIASKTPTTVTQKYQIDCTVGSLTVAGYATEVEQETAVLCSSGALTIAGLASTVSSGNQITCTAGALVVVGKNATVTQKYQIDSTAGSLTIAGANVLVNLQANISCTHGTLTVAGYDATLTLPSTILCATGAVTIAGQGTTVISSTLVEATTGAITIAGFSATLPGQATTVDCTLGTVVIAGKNAAIALYDTYYMRADGTAANKAAATGPASTQSACMNITVHNGETFYPGDTIVVADDGGEYRGELIPPSSGWNGLPITYVASGSPIILGSEKLTESTYKWTASGSGTNEWFCEIAAGGDPGLTEPDQPAVFLDNVRLTEGSALGSLNDHEWLWGLEPVSGAYSTVYIRDDTGDPDTSGVVIEAAQRLRCINYRNLSDLTFDGIDCKWTNGTAIWGFGDSDRLTFKNLTTSYNSRSGLQLVGGDDCLVSNVISEYNCGCAFGCSGGGSGANNLLVTGCTMRESIAIYKDSFSNDASGMKAFNLYDSTIEKCHVYNNDWGGIRPDGGLDEGCDRNIVQFNHVHNNGLSFEFGVPQIYVEFSQDNHVRYNLVHDGIGDGGSVGLACAHARATGNVFYGNVIYSETGQFRGAIEQEYESSGNYFYNNTIYDCSNGFYVQEACTLKNNIVVGSTYYDLYIATGDSAEITSDYNCFSGDGSAAIAEYFNTEYTVAEWYAAFGQDEHSIQSDPKLEDPSNGKFWLQPGSPCIDAGTNLGATYDDALHQRSSWPSAVYTEDQDDWGSGWDIGAFAHVGVYQNAVGAITVAANDAAVGIGATVNATKKSILLAAYNATLAGATGIDATRGAITISGHNATVTAGQAVNQTATGTVTITDYGADIIFDERIFANYGAILVQPRAPTIAADVAMVATKGAVTATGYNPTVNTGNAVTASLGAVLVSALATTVELDTTVIASTDAIVIAGYAASVSSGNEVAATRGIVTVTGYDPSIVVPAAISATTGTVTIAGYASSVSAGSEIATTKGAVTIAGYSASVAADTGITATSGAITLAGHNAALASDNVIAATKGAVTLAGNAATVNAELVISALTGSITAASYAATIVFDATVNATTGAITLTGYATDITSAQPTDVLATLGTVSITAISPVISLMAYVNNPYVVSATPHRRIVSTTTRKTATSSTPERTIEEAA